MASPFEGTFRVFRITVGIYPVFDGGGAFKWGGRWTSPGRHVINTASTYALALLENLVHWNIGAIPPGQRFVIATIPADVSRQILDPGELPGWDAPDYGTSQQFGDAWYDSGRAALLVVPSVLSPFEPNVLVNQRHPECARISVGPEQPAAIDRRLVR